MTPRIIKALWPPVSITISGALLALHNPWVGAPLAILGALDTHGRWRDFNYLKSFSYIPIRLVQYYGQSFCGREIVKAVDSDPEQISDFYRYLGYRPWQVLPNGFPRVAFKVSFWRNLVLGHRGL